MKIYINKNIIYLKKYIKFQFIYSKRCYSEKIINSNNNKYIKEIKKKIKNYELLILEGKILLVYNNNYH